MQVGTCWALGRRASRKHARRDRERSAMYCASRRTRTRTATCPQAPEAARTARSHGLFPTGQSSRGLRGTGARRSSLDTPPRCRPRMGPAEGRRPPGRPLPTGTGSAHIKQMLPNQLPGQPLLPLPRSRKLSGVDQVWGVSREVRGVIPAAHAVTYPGGGQPRAWPCASRRWY